MNNSVLEIAIRKLKEGQQQPFTEARKAFIDKLKKQKGVEKDWEFKSFFTMPEPDDTDVFVGMTRYESPQAMQAIADELLSSPEVSQFFNTFNMKAFLAVQPADNNAFNLEDYIHPGNVLEVAARSIKEGMEPEFNTRRNAFFRLISEQPGYLFDREFIDMQSGDRVVLIGWQSQDQFLKAANYLQSQNEMADFFSILNVKAYQALLQI